MVTTPSRKTAVRGLGSVLGALGAAAFATSALSANSGQVIELTQVGCQFVESENGVDHMYKTTKKADCEAINARSGSERLAKAKVLELEPGDYVFRVKNKNVPYQLGFYLREKGFNSSNPIHQATKIAVSGGGLDRGVTKDYKVTLKPGEYVYSCPLNTTPDYRLVVSN